MLAVSQALLTSIIAREVTSRARRNTAAVVLGVISDTSITLVRTRPCAGGTRGITRLARWFRRGIRVASTKHKQARVTAGGAFRALCVGRARARGGYEVAFGTTRACSTHGVRGAGPSIEDILGRAARFPRGALFGAVRAALHFALGARLARAGGVVGGTHTGVDDPFARPTLDHTGRTLVRIDAGRVGAGATVGASTVRVSGRLLVHGLAGLAGG